MFNDLLVFLLLIVFMALLIALSFAQPKTMNRAALKIIAMVWLAVGVLGILSFYVVPMMHE